jgi:hypothetical protein
MDHLKAFSCKMAQAANDGRRSASPFMPLAGDTTGYSGMGLR